MLIKDQIIDKLKQNFNPSLLNVEDQSEMHRGHAGWNEKGESHFHIRISSSLFSGLSRIKQHRAIYEALTKKLVKKKKVKLYGCSMEYIMRRQKKLPTKLKLNLFQTNVLNKNIKDYF